MRPPIMILLATQEASQASPRARRADLESPGTAVLDTGLAIRPWGEIMQMTITTTSIRTRHSMQIGISFLRQRTKCSLIGEIFIVLFQKRLVLCHRVP